MNQSFKERATNRLSTIIASEVASNHNIIVLLGLASYLDLSRFSDNIVDPDSFDVDGDASLFDEEEWFSRVFLTLRHDLEFFIMSYQQFVYYTTYAPNFSKFKEKVVIVYDNIRSLYPIQTQSYVERANPDNIEERPKTIPLYQAEQVLIEGNAYCSYIIPSEYKMVKFFSRQIEIGRAEKNCDYILEVDEHAYMLDVFLNKAIIGMGDIKVLGVPLVNNAVRENGFNQRLEMANGLLFLMGAGEIVYTSEDRISTDYTPCPETITLLKRFWGENAEFRSINVYQNPGESNKVIAISQGQIVDLIINEYKKCGCPDVAPDDVFITAPTGSGKSLLFQLPAFYVSEHGDVTLVISPLIALMKDQVNAIRSDRGFNKVAYLNSELNLIDRDHIINQCKAGEIDILYLSPELLLSYDIGFFIGERRLGLMVIDEAHLITTWGRDFRVDYWHLGNHINKIRKYRGMRFPLVALTATAIYGGPNDMIVDSMGSLYMHNPRLFLGQIKRDNIQFVINNYRPFRSGYRQNKTEQTVEFIKDANHHHLKTVVYVPYTRHVVDITNQVKDITVPYYGSLSAEEKEYAYNRFRSNEVRIMVCTKAFGMGVDIPDIQVIYHHAPSGLLPDYVQEVGRVARDPNMTGFAALNYNEADKQYSMQLFGMSSIRPWQIREVLKKIYSIYKLNNQRNLLVSSDDFSYIFNDGDNDGEKIKTALMMIEKDYLNRVRYNAILARPKQLFVKCYARTDAFGLSVLERCYGDSYRVLRDLGEKQTVVEIELDKIWKKDFSNMSFGLLKREFYNGALLKSHGAKLVALTKFTLSLKRDYSFLKDRFFFLLNSLEEIFNQLGYKDFKEESFLRHLEPYYEEKSSRKQIARYVLSAFSGRMLGPDTIEDNAFLQRREYGEVTYRVLNQSYRVTFSNMKRTLVKMFEGRESSTVTRFFSSENGDGVTYSRLGSLLELLNMATFEMRGGDNPMIFIRINDPERIRIDSEDLSYRNDLLNRTIKRHEISNEIFDYFFTNSLTNKDRWDFIEEFFLGATNEELFEQFPESANRNHVDIIKYIVDNAGRLEQERKEVVKNKESFTDFPPRKDGWYDRNNILTIENRTMTVGNWIITDPVSLDETCRKNNLRLSKSEFETLMIQLRRNHYEYYKEIMGLNLLIEYKGYEGRVPALVPYSNDPVGFYKWWSKKENAETVTLSKIDIYKLLIKVYEMAPSALLTKHKRLIIK